MEIKKIKELYCPCCWGKKYTEIKNDCYAKDEDKRFKCNYCSLIFEIEKTSSCFKVSTIPRNARISSFDNMVWSSDDCIECKKYGTTGRSGGADNPKEWESRCEICGALVHSNCGAFSNRECSVCRKFKRTKEIVYKEISEFLTDEEVKKELKRRELECQ